MLQQDNKIQQIEIVSALNLRLFFILTFSRALSPENNIKSLIATLFAFYHTFSIID